MGGQLSWLLLLRFFDCRWYSSEMHGRYETLSGLLSAGSFGIWVRRTASRKRPMYDILGGRWVD